MKSEAPKVLASACKALPAGHDEHIASWTVEGVGATNAVVLIASAKAPKTVQLEQKVIDSFSYDEAEK